MSTFAKNNLKILVTHKKCEIYNFALALKIAEQ